MSGVAGEEHDKSQECVEIEREYQQIPFVPHEQLRLFYWKNLCTVRILKETRRVPFAFESRGAREWREGARKLKFRNDPDCDSDSRPSARFAGKTRTSFLLRGNAAMPDKHQSYPLTWAAGEARVKKAALLSQSERRPSDSYFPNRL